MKLFLNLIAALAPTSFSLSTTRIVAWAILFWEQ